MSSAVTELRNAVVGLGGSVAELVMIVHEDRPARDDLAVVDHVGEVVSELQGSVAGASSTLAVLTDPRRLPACLPALDDQLALASTHYWRDLRGYEATSDLRRGIQGRGSGWRTWTGSVEASLRRCEAPLDHALSGVRSAWREVGELLDLYLPVSPSDLNSLHSHVPEENR